MSDANKTKDKPKPFWKSKKWLMAVVGILVEVIGHFWLNMPAEAMISIAGVVVAFILGEAAIDAKAVKK